MSTITSELHWHLTTDGDQPADGDLVVVAYRLGGVFYWPADSGLQDTDVILWTRAMFASSNYATPYGLPIPNVIAWARIRLPNELLQPGCFPPAQLPSSNEKSVPPSTLTHSVVSPVPGVSHEGGPIADCMREPCVNEPK